MLPTPTPGRRLACRPLHRSSLSISLDGALPASTASPLSQGRAADLIEVDQVAHVPRLRDALPSLKPAQFRARDHEVGRDLVWLRGGRPASFVRTSNGLASPWSCRKFRPRTRRACRAGRGPRSPARTSPTRTSPARTSPIYPGDVGWASAPPRTRDPHRRRAGRGRRVRQRAQKLGRLRSGSRGRRQGRSAGCHTPLPTTPGVLGSRSQSVTGKAWGAMCLRVRG